jgi:hypothetical protein
MAKGKTNIPPEMEQSAYRLFYACLPYYWKTADELPAGIRFHLALNGYGAAAMACVDIANHWIVTPKLAREVQKSLVHMQTWKGVEPNE